MLRVSAKADYAVRALLELASRDGTPMKVTDVAAACDIPARFLGVALNEMRGAGLLESKRGGGGGYWLAVPPEAITVADVLRAVEGAVSDIRAVPGRRSATVERMWAASREGFERVVDAVTLADLLSGRLPG